MKMGIRFSGAAYASECKKHHPEYGNLWRKIVEFKAILHQRADRAIVVLVKIIVMVLRDSQEARDHERCDYGFEKFHRGVTRSTFWRCG